MTEQVQYELTLKDLLTDKLKNADNVASKFESTIRNIGVAVGISFGTAAIIGFGKKVIEAGSYVENARTGLTTLLKDSNEAAGVIKNTMDDATKTPFAFEGLLMANKALISTGMSAADARADVLNLANAIAATGGGDDELQRMVVNMQQIRNTGKATALDIKQFAYAGVNIYKILADATGKPIEKVKDMEVSYDMLSMALKKAHDQGGVYAGGLENMMNNTSVQVSNLQDSVFQLSVKIFDDLKPAITGVISGLSTFIGWLSQGWDWLVKNKDIVYALAIGVTAGAVAWGAYQLVMNAATIGTTIMTAAQWALNAALTANPVGLVVTAIGALVAAVIAAYNRFAWFRAFLWASWAVIKEVGSLIADFFMGLKDVIVGVFTFDTEQVKRGMLKQADVLFNSGKRVANAAKQGWQEGMADFAKSQAEDKKATTNAPGTIKGVGKGKTTPTITDKPQAKGAQGSKNVTITVNIQSLIKDFKISTTNIQETSSKVREYVTQALISATNDSQLIAGNL